MPRDYAHYTKDKGRPKKSKSKGKKTGFGKKIRLLLALLLIIVLVIIVIRLFHNNITEPKKPTVRVKTQPVVVKKDKQQEKATASSEVQFDFYTILPKAEVNVQSANNGQNKYILQIAIVNTINDAKHLESELSLLGLDVFAQPVKIKGESKYQVNIGPYVSKDAALSDQKKLQANNIKTKLIEGK